MGQIAESYKINARCFQRTNFDTTHGHHEFCMRFRPTEKIPMRFRTLWSCAEDGLKKFPLSPSPEEESLPKNDPPLCSSVSFLKEKKLSPPLGWSSAPELPKKLDIVFSSEIGLMFKVYIVKQICMILSVETSVALYLFR